MYCTSAVPTGSETGIDALELELLMVASCCVVSENRADPLQEHPELSAAEPSLQPRVSSSQWERGRHFIKKERLWSMGEGAEQRSP